MFARVAFALTAVVWALPVGAQTASIEGQVVNLKTGAPLRDAMVTITGPYARAVLGPDDDRLPITARVTSGDQGRFTFHNLAAGNYSISASRNGFENGGYYANRAAIELLPVADGQQVRDIVIKLAPLGVFAGKVVDEAGKPLENARITVYRYSGGEWLRASQTGEPTSFGYTNDLGEYRAALRSGYYFISAAYPFGVGRLEPDLTPGMGHPTTYYPNALGPDQAESLKLASGETVKADFTLKKAPAYRISGYMTGPEGRLWENACVGIVPKGSAPSGMLMIGSISTGGQDGSFRIVDVPPGSYTLMGCASQTLLHGTQDVDVSGNVDGVKLQVATAQPLKGTLKVEGDVNLLGATLFLIGNPASTSAKLDGGSELRFDRVLPGIRYIPEIRRLPPSCYVKSIRYGGQDVPPEGFVRVAGSSLEVTVSAAGAAQLTGSVTDSAGHPVRYPLVTVIPADGGPAASAKRTLGDAEGKFSFEALRPGAYLAAAWEDFINLVPLTREAGTLRLYRDRSKAVTVQSGPAASIALTVIGSAELELARSKP